ERLKQNVEALSSTDELNDLELSVTIGVAVAKAEDDLDMLITRADNLLYEGKRDGRNQVVMKD
ncbi:diguanylate cyclase domain-containing protein, partial [Idiomarina abyssalis]